MTTATWNGTVIAESDDVVTVEGNACFPRWGDDVPDRAAFRSGVEVR